MPPLVQDVAPRTIPVQVHPPCDPAPPILRPRVRPTKPTARILVDGVAFDPMTEQQTSAYVHDCLDAGFGGQIITPNVDILRVLRTPEARGLAVAATLVVADGMPVVWASRITRTPVPVRVAGASLVHTLSRDAAARGKSLFLLGGAPGAAELAAQNLLLDHPELRIAGTACPAWGFHDDPAQWAELVAQIRAAQPDIIFLALGAPKQELVAQRLHEFFPETWYLGCGGSLSFLAGLMPRAPEWMQRSGLEWIFRLATEPRRLWRRYLVHDVPYALSLLARATAARVRQRPHRIPKAAA